jgi:hypothetical protein
LEEEGKHTAGEEESHHLIDEIVVGEGAGFEGDREDINGGLLAGGPLLFRGLNEIGADGAHNANWGVSQVRQDGGILARLTGMADIVVTLDGKLVDKPARDEERDEAKYTALGGGLEQGLVCLAESV